MSIFAFVIPAKAGIQYLIRILDSGLKTAGMTTKQLNVYKVLIEYL